MSICFGFSGEYIQVNPYKGNPSWGELTEKTAQTLFWTVSVLSIVIPTVKFSKYDFIQGFPILGNQWTLINDQSDLYNFCLYCSATFVTSQVLQPKSVKKWYRDRHLLVILHSSSKLLLNGFNVRVILQRYFNLSRRRSYWLTRSVFHSTTKCILLFHQRPLTYFVRGSITVGTDDPLFDWLGFSCFAYVAIDRDLQVWSNPYQSNRRSAVQ